MSRPDNFWHSGSHPKPIKFETSRSNLSTRGWTSWNEDYISHPSTPFWGADELLDILAPTLKWCDTHTCCYPRAKIQCRIPYMVITMEMDINKEQQYQFQKYNADPLLGASTHLRKYCSLLWISVEEIWGMIDVTTVFKFTLIFCLSVCLVLTQNNGTYTPQSNFL